MMSTLMAQDYIDHARDTLFDPAPGAGWSDAELIRYLNAAVTATIALKPNALPKYTTLALDPGVQQSIPSDGVMFMDALFNTVDDTVTVQSMHEVTRVQEGWVLPAQNSPTKYVFYDPRSPTTFHVYPRAQSGDRLRILYGAQADRVAAAGDDVELSPIYETALWAYMVAMANMKQSKRQNPAQYAIFMKLFLDQVDMITKNEANMSARVDIKGEQG